jgi:hypothetical protein
MKKQKQTKKAGSSRKAPKTPAAALPPKTPRTRERDPRLPAAGTVLTRPYKGKDLKVTVLADGFRFDGKEYRSLSALASAATGAASINGFLWMGLTGRKAATPKPRSETESPAVPTNTRAPKKGGAKVRRAGRDPQPSLPPTDAVPESAPAAESATA